MLCDAEWSLLWWMSQRWKKYFVFCIIAYLRATTEELSLISSMTAEQAYTCNRYIQQRFHLRICSSILAFAYRGEDIGYAVLGIHYPLFYELGTVYFVNARISRLGLKLTRGMRLLLRSRQRLSKRYCIESKYWGQEATAIIYCREIQTMS